MRIIVIGGMIMLVVVVIIRCRKIDVIETMRGRRRGGTAARLAESNASSSGQEMIKKISENYYTKAQVDEKIDKLEQTIRIIAKNADKYIQRIAKDFYQ